MNIRAMANAMTSGINPNIAATTLKSTGNTTATDGRRTPTWEVGTASIQVQGVSAKDLQFMAGQGIMGTLRQVFAPGYWQGPNRPGGTGGDIFRFPEQSGGPDRDWKVVLVKGVYNDWTQIIVQMQTALVALPEGD